MILSRGNATSGIRAVTPSGSDSPIHQKPISTTVAAMYFACGVIPEGVGPITINRNRTIPSQKPAVLRHRGEAGIVIEVSDIVFSATAQASSPQFPKNA